MYRRLTLQRFSLLRAPRRPLNRGWYERLISKGEGFAPLYRAAGLESCVDLLLIEEQQWLPKDKSAPVLVIGPGDGRDINKLLEFGYTNITAVENHPQIFADLEKKFIDDFRLTLVLSDIRDYKAMPRFATVLWLWCGIDEIPKEQQSAIIQQVMTVLLPDGVFVYDTPVKDTISNVTVGKDIIHAGGTYNAELRDDDTVFRAYLPTKSELMNNLGLLKDQCVLADFQIQPYTTTTGRERLLAACFPHPELYKSLNRHPSPRL